MKIYKTPLLLLGIGLALSSLSCGSKKNETKLPPISEDDNCDLVETELDLIDKSFEYDLKNNKITTYFYKDGHIPFIGVKELISKLEGYFIKDPINYKYNQLTDTVTLTQKKYKQNYFTFNVKNGLIYTNNLDFFDFTEQMEGISYNRFLTNYFLGQVPGKDELSFNVKNYGYELFDKDDDILVPIDLINSLFLEPNLASLIYNGESINFFSYYIDDEEEYKTIRNKNLEGKELPEDLVEARKRDFYFTFDNFYGLKDFKNIESFKTIVESDPELSKLFNSNKIEDLNKGLLQVCINYLDDPHTYAGFKSLYDVPNDDGSLRLRGSEYVGERTHSIDDAYYELTDLYNETFTDKKGVRFEGNTAFIKFDKFDVGRDEDIYDENHEFKPDAYFYDTFVYLTRCFESIAKRGDTIKNVVIDLSTNGGGTISSSIASVGFLTNDSIPYLFGNTVLDSLYYFGYDIDVNMDGSFKDDDAHTNYNYYVLTSPATFSAANLFTATCKGLGCAKIIGQKSGGGMCGVSQKVLPDGTIMNHSGTIAMQGFEFAEGGINAFDIEDGIEPDYKIDMSNFFDLPYLNNFINNLQ